MVPSLTNEQVTTVLDAELDQDAVVKDRDLDTAEVIDFANKEDLIMRPDKPKDRLYRRK